MTNNTYTVKGIIGWFTNTPGDDWSGEYEANEIVEAASIKAAEDAALDILKKREKWADCWWKSARVTHKIKEIGK